MFEDIITEMTRGDNHNIPFKRQDKDGNVIYDKPDKMYATFKKNSKTNDFVIQKSFDNGITFDETTGEYVIELEPKDTNELRYGDYIFDIEIIKNEKVKTIAKGTLTITDEATFNSNKV